MAENDPHRYDHFYGLITRHRELIESMCMHRASGDSHYCAQLRQECYIAIWKHEKQIASDIAPLQETLWIYWLCRGAFSRHRFLHRTHLFVSLDETFDDSLAAPDDDDNTCLRDRIESLAAVLTPHERRAVGLMAEGYTPDEMARELGIRPHSAVQLRYRTIAKLRHHFKQNNDSNNKQ